MRPALLTLLIAPALLFAGCTAPTDVREPEVQAEPVSPAFPSTYRPLPSGPVAITHATILTGTDQQLDDATILMQDGVIRAVGRNIDLPDGVTLVDGTGKWVTPGLIDVHSHLGVYPSPSHEANADGNELTNPNTAQVWAEHSVWPQDPQFTLALAGGVTTLQILPGSGNLFGGRSVTLRNLPATTVQQMKFPGAPYGLKMACGENPKRVYGTRDQAPQTRMGEVAGYRTAWIQAADYIRKWQAYHDKVAKGEEAEPPLRDLQLETLAGVLKGEILVHNHCYRSEEMAVMIDIAKEFGYHVTAFHHAVEAYKIADLLAKNDVCAVMWPDWWGFKQEAFDMVEANIAIVDHAGACAIVHSDSATTGQHLNQETAKALASARDMGYDVSRAHAIKWITANPAKALGILDKTGTLEPGKMADVVLWDGDPFSVYTRTARVYMDGALVFDRADRAHQPVTDFDLGILDPDKDRLQ